MKAFAILWRFSRPHTVVGSVISILAIYMIICEGNKTAHLPLLALALLVGITCNIFIVGINQVADVEVDRINKPYLPIPSGELNLRQAGFISCAALALSLGLALYLSPYLFLVILFSSVIGWAYSMPPLCLRQHHLPAALAIASVRGVVMNIGGFMVFNYLVNRSLEIPENVIILTIFTVAFSIVISWFKDLPDMEGDARYRIRTFALLYSSRTAWLAGSLLVSAGYVFTLCFNYFKLNGESTNAFKAVVLFYGHVALFVLFIVHTFFIRLNDRDSVRRFYKRFWYFFFGEYLVYLIAYL